MPLLESESDSKAAPARQELKVRVDELLGTLTPKQADGHTLRVDQEAHSRIAAELLGLPRPQSIATACRPYSSFGVIRRRPTAMSADEAIHKPSFGPRALGRCVDVAYRTHVGT